MNLPPRIADAVEEIGAARQAGQLARQDAVTALRDVIIGHADDALIKGIVADFAGRSLDTWQRQHAHPGPYGAAAQIQSELFPELPLRLQIRPGVAKALILFTGHDWDMARNVLENRTRNAKAAAETDWASFEAAYAIVRPLLGGSLTTAEVADHIRQTA